MWMPCITNVTKDLSQKAEAVEAIEVIADLNPGSLVLAQIVVSVTHPGSVRHMVKNVFTAKKGTLQSIILFQAMLKISRSRVEKSNQ